MIRDLLMQLAYLVGTALFVFALYWMNDPKTARKGVFAGVAAMLLAILGTLLAPEIVNWTWIAGAIVLGFVVGIPLSLGSYWAVLPAVLTCLVLVVRTVLEDRTLQAELPGYAEYAQRVRYRVLPGLW